MKVKSNLNVKLLKQALYDKGFTQSTIASKINVTQACVSRWFSGVSAPCLEHSKKLCELLGIELSDLFEHEGNRFSNIYKIEKRFLQEADKMETQELTDYILAIHKVKLLAEKYAEEDQE